MIHTVNLTPYEEYVLNKMLETKRNTIAKEESIAKEKKPLTAVDKVAAEFKEYGLDWTGNDTITETQNKEHPIDVMFTKVRRGIY